VQGIIILLGRRGLSHTFLATKGPRHAHRPMSPRPRQSGNLMKSIIVTCICAMPTLWQVHLSARQSSNIITCNPNYSENNISQGSVATYLRCGGIFSNRFIAVSNLESERIFKIGTF